jgi:hypothetical protein
MSLRYCSILCLLLQILKGHKTLMNFDLTFNPLGEAGARSIFRSILRGVTCWVFMVRTVCMIFGTVSLQIAVQAGTASAVAFPVCARTCCDTA